ncbi:hypothetical protein VN97_g13250 [Penicillium thymicola]|uniref:Uncharacterized protein n=1 Tax=Penicillium thymicola TaxID=293382 RepID=A0AAI9T4A5_PENTH|nr:hypothetical protein VN97_g13250 [Penicillium thymicola]
MKPFISIQMQISHFVWDEKFHFWHLQTVQESGDISFCMEIKNLIFDTCKPSKNTEILPFVYLDWKLGEERERERERAIVLVTANC